MDPKTKMACDISYLPVRKEAADSAEMTSMLLFGEGFNVIESRGNWHRILMDYDQYEGWIFRKKLDDFLSHEGRRDLIHGSFSFLVGSYGTQLPLSIGSEVPANADHFYLDGEEFPLHGIGKGQDESAASVIQRAKGLLGIPYLWGGRGAFGFDCSGFTQVLLKTAGLKVSRDASQQISEGYSVSFDERKPGDLAFFENDEGKIVHVGILEKSPSIIHCSEKVRKDELTAEGIKRADMGEITHKLHSLRRYLE